MKFMDLKDELKASSIELKKLKKRIKTVTLINDRAEAQSNLHYKKWYHRHKHIVYCMLKGRKYEEIERSCHVAPDFDRIERELGAYRAETVCTSA